MEDHLQSIEDDGVDLKRAQCQELINDNTTSCVVLVSMPLKICRELNEVLAQQNNCCKTTRQILSFADQGNILSWTDYI